MFLEDLDLERRVDDYECKRLGEKKCYVFLICIYSVVSYVIILTNAYVWAYNII